MPGAPTLKPPSRAKVHREQQGEITVIGVPNAPLRDIYHRFLRAPWWAALVALVASFLLLNAGFAVLYLISGGLANARPGSFADAFYFSVQTMGTIGYGAMYPLSPAANILMVAEAVVSLLVTAVGTGLVFTKFSQANARVVFGDRVTISPMDGTPTLMLRIGNARGNTIIEAMIRVVLIRTERTREGMLFYRMYDLPLSRERSPALSRSWTALHNITEASVLSGETPASLKKNEVELLVTLVGIDDTSLQPVHARHRYTDAEIVWGARPADILSEDDTGGLVLDLTLFHAITETAPTADFPYPAPAPAATPDDAA